MKYIASLICSALFGASFLRAEPVPIRIGFQPSGTLAWELEVLNKDPRLASSDYRIEPRPSASAEAGKIALQSGAVDMILADWIWVSRLRAEGAGFTFYPYSTTSGSLMAPEKSGVKSIKDLPGKKLGIAGGELDKNWLLLQALARNENIDLNKSVEKVFGAPPLINEQLKLGRVDAALNYWHFGAKLETQGFHQLLDGKELLRMLGVQEAVPTLGYVFKESWGRAHQQALSALFNNAKKAKDLLCDDSRVWETVLPLVQEPDLAVQNRLRQRYCEGRIKQWSNAEQQAAERIFSMLRQVSDNQLTGKSEHIQAGTFWQTE